MIKADSHRKFRLVAMDLDGTLYTDEKKITDETVKALEEVTAKGVKIVAATGRLFRDIPGEVKNLPGFSYGIACNGAAVLDHQGKVIYSDMISFDDYSGIARAVREEGMLLDVFTLDRIYRDISDRAKVDKLDILGSMKRFMLGSREDIDDLYAFLEEKQLPLCKLTVNFPKGDVQRERLKEILKDFPEYTSVTGGYGNRELTKKTTTKGVALLRLAEKLGIPVEETMAMGDSGNDLDMIKKAGLGVAMGNAEPDILEVADYVTKTNEEDGVAFALREWIY